jgi:hypothetical protein
VVGIAVAQAAHVVGALEAPGGALRQRATPIEASAQGAAQVVHGLKTWGEPDALLSGLQATDVLWEALYEAVTQAGYSVLVLNPPQTASWAKTLGLRGRAREARRAPSGARPVGGLCPW